MRSHSRSFGVLALLLLSACGAGTLIGQMIDPAIDRADEPFSYFSHPTDVIGVMDGQEATLVTPEGYLYTGFGELMFFAGNPLAPIAQRVKTLEKGYLPILRYAYACDGIRYEACMFAATLDGRPESPLMNFIRFTVINQTPHRRRAFFAAAVRHQNEENTDWGFGDHRFARPVKTGVLGGHEQAGVAFSPEWVYTFQNDAFIRDGKVMYLFPRNPSPSRMMTLRNGGNEIPPTGPQQIPCLPSTPVGVVAYDPVLSPGEHVEFIFKMPYAPIDSSDRLAGELRYATFGEYHKRTVEFWEDLLAPGLEITLPEPKVIETFKANLVYSLIARNKQEGHLIQKVNEFQYDAFWIRDASYFIRMYDLSGYHTIAGECLAFLLRWQKEDGNFLSQGGQFDGWGQALWAYGQHVRITRDTAFAAAVYPAMRRAFQWLQTARQGDPYRLIPTTTPGDNEDITGHVTGHNFWALAGLRNLISVARDLGKQEDVIEFSSEYQDLRSALLERLKLLAPLTGGAIPPGLDSPGGQDWGNMMSVYPEQILDPFDSLVTATLEATRKKYQEGIMTYGSGRYLHHYLTMKNTETEVIRGDQETALEEFYAVLLHTSSTHTGFEFYVLPWGTRDFGMNLAPHGWFSAKFRALMRNMLIREEENTLHLFSVLSPAWIEPGKVVAVRKAPTTFGTVHAELACGPGNATLTLEPSWQHEPDAIVIHVPWFMQVDGVSAPVADGGTAVLRGDRIICGPGVSRIDIAWSPLPQPAQHSFTATVEKYKAEYRERYDAWMSGSERGSEQ
ncbi:MAG: hypothetical protein IT282_07955 [Bacteroidetes bacterium]|nr:hypothetical protein [Bacteroidota bacterium]